LNEDPAGIHVRRDAPWRRASAIIDAARSNGGVLKASGAGRKAIWHVSVERWAMASGLGAEGVAWESARNASVAAQSLVVGGPDVVVCSVPEIQMSPSIGGIKTLAIMGRKRHPRYPGIPTLAEQGLDVRAGLWRGVAGPPGLAKPAGRRITASLRRIAGSSAFGRPMLRRGFGLAFADGDAFADYMAEEQEAMRVAMVAIGTGPYEGPKMRRPSSPP
jgi:tripartite-type tricarboxylate transporter receptor subunit TctC